MTTPHPYDWAIEHGPIGVWQTASGTANVLMHSVLTLSQDGTGSVAHHSTLSGQETFSLLWRFDRAGEFKLYQGNEDYPHPQNEDEWDVFNYRADWRTFDTGSGPVLVNDAVDDGWLTKDGFWRLDSPVLLLSRS